MTNKDKARFIPTHFMTCVQLVRCSSTWSCLFLIQDHMVMMESLAHTKDNMTSLDLFWYAFFLCFVMLLPLLVIMAAVTQILHANACRAHTGGFGVITALLHIDTSRVTFFLYSVPSKCNNIRQPAVCRPVAMWRNPLSAGIVFLNQGHLDENFLTLDRIRQPAPYYISEIIKQVPEWFLGREEEQKMNLLLTKCGVWPNLYKVKNEIFEELGNWCTVKTVIYYPPGDASLS